MREASALRSCLACRLTGPCRSAPPDTDGTFLEAGAYAPCFSKEPLRAMHNRHVFVLLISLSILLGAILLLIEIYRPQKAKRTSLPASPSRHCRAIASTWRFDAPCAGNATIAPRCQAHNPQVAYETWSRVTAGQTRPSNSLLQSSEVVVRCSIWQSTPVPPIDNYSSSRWLRRAPSRAPRMAV